MRVLLILPYLHAPSVLQDSKKPEAGNHGGLFYISQLRNHLGQDRERQEKHVGHAAEEAHSLVRACKFSAQ